MFKDEQTGNIIHANLNDTVIRATLRNCDLIPAFLDVIRDTPEYTQIIQHMPAYVSDDQLAEWWEQGGAVFVIEDLFVALDSYAPSGYRFGAHDGDGSDFGYWRINDECEHCGHWESYFADKDVVHCVDCGKKLK